MPKGRGKKAKPKKPGVLARANEVRRKRFEKEEERVAEFKKFAETLPDPKGVSPDSPRRSALELLDKNWRTRAAASGFLGWHGKKALKPLAFALKDVRWEVKNAAIRALTGLKERSPEVKVKEVGDLILPLINDPYVSIFAVDALVKIKDKRAIKPIIERMLQPDTPALFLSHHAFALSRFKDKKMIEPLRELLKRKLQGKQVYEDIKQVIKALEQGKSAKPEFPWPKKA